MIKEGLEKRNTANFDSYSREYYNMDDMYFKKYAFSISVVISGPHIDFSNVKTQEQIETITKALESSKYIDQNLTESWLRDFLDYIKRNEVCMYNNPSSNKISHNMIFLACTSSVYKTLSCYNTM